MGFEVGNGYGVEFDSYQNPWDPSSNHISLFKNNPDHSVSTPLAVANTADTENNPWEFEDGAWHTAKIKVMPDSVEVYLDDFSTPKLTWSGTLDNTYSGVGLTASTGYYYNTQLIDDVTIVSSVVETVNSHAADGYYKAGNVIPIHVKFSTPVTVSGSPQLQLNTGRMAQYVDGTGTDTLIFHYTVAAGDTVADLNYISSDALQLAGGSIADGTAHAADLTLPAVGSSKSLAAIRNIAVDTSAPSGTLTIGVGGGLGLVTLNLSASDTGAGVTDMRFSNNGTTWTDWESYATSRNYTLPGAIGNRTVYVQYRDGAGNISPVISSMRLAPNAGLGGALDLSSGGYLLIPGAAGNSFSGGDDFTVSMWVYAAQDTTGKTQTLYRKNAAAIGEMQTWIYIEDNRFKFGLDDFNVNGWTILTSVASVPPDQWTHLAAVKSGNYIQLYINGILDNQTSSLAYANSVPSIQPVFIGSDNADNQFTGQLDEIQIWHAALDGETLRNWMERPINPTHPQFTNLAAYYKLNDGGAFALDSKGGNDASIVTIAESGWAFSGVRETLQVLEDHELKAILNAEDAYGGIMAYQIVSNPTIGTLQLTDSHTGAFTYTPWTNANGLDSFAYKVNNGTLESNVVWLNIRVNPVNDAPSFVGGGNQTVTSQTYAQVVPGWATFITAGPPDEAGQELNFIVASDYPDLFSVQPAIDASGTLSYAPSGVYGSSTVRVSLHDNGGVADGGADTSAEQSFTITVAAPPSIGTISISPYGPTNGNVTVMLDVYREGTPIAQVKWAKGELLPDDFVTGGTIVTDNRFTVTENGTYTIYVEDALGGKTVSYMPITNIDKVAPVITLNGNATEIVELGQPYADPGVTAWDERDGDLTPQLTVTGSVYTGQTGTYALTYHVSDMAGNMAAATRTVKVVDSNAYLKQVVVIGGALGAAFDPLQTSYTIYADNDFRIRPVPAASGASWTVTGATYAAVFNGEVAIKPDLTSYFQIKVTAKDGATSQTYGFYVSRVSGYSWLGFAVSNEEGTKLTLRFETALDLSAVLSPANFVLNGTPVKVSSAVYDPLDTSKRTIWLNLSDPIGGSEQVSLSIINSGVKTASGQSVNILGFPVLAPASLTQLRNEMDVGHDGIHMDDIVNYLVHRRSVVGSPQFDRNDAEFLLTQISSYWLSR